MSMCAHRQRPGSVESSEGVLPHCLTTSPTLPSSSSNPDTHFGIGSSSAALTEAVVMSMLLSILKKRKSYSQLCKMESLSFA